MILSIGALFIFFFTALGLIRSLTGRDDIAVRITRPSTWFSEATGEMVMWFMGFLGAVFGVVGTVHRRTGFEAFLWSVLGFAIILFAAIVSRAIHTKCHKVDQFTSPTSGQATNTKVSTRTPRLLLVSAVLSTVALVSAWSYGALHLIEHHFNWQSEAATTLTQLHAGYSISFFRDTLGSPIISKLTSRDYTEDIFKERGYWVETLTRGGGEVDFYSVSICNSGITPTIAMPGVGKVTLNVSTLASVTSHAECNYWFRGRSGSDSPTMKEFTYGAAAGDFRSFMWGLSSSCPDSVNSMQALQDRFPSLLRGPVGSSQIRAIPSLAIVNMYGETAPDVAIGQLPNRPEELGVNPSQVDLSAGATDKRFQVGMTQCIVVGEYNPVGAQPCG